MQAEPGRPVQERLVQLGQQLLNLSTTLDTPASPITATTLKATHVNILHIN